MNRLLRFSLIVCLFPATSLFAAEPASVLEEVVVTATRHEDKLSSVPANATIITEGEIRNSSALNVPELLRSQAGVQVYDMNGNRRSYTVDLRGFGESAATNALVLVDGRRVTQPDLSGTDWAQVPLDRVRRIEIVRGGGGSVLYGDNAGGGVINIITKEGEERLIGGSVSGGSYDTVRANAFVGDSGKSISTMISGNYVKSSGYRENSQTEGRDLGINFNYFPGDNLKLNLSGGYHWDKTGLPGALKESDFAAGKKRRDSIFPNDFAETEDYYVKGSPEVYFWGESLVRLDLSFRRRDFESFSSGSFGNFTGKTNLKTLDFSPHVVLKKTAGRWRNSLTIGLDLHDVKEGINNDSLFFGVRTIKDFALKKEGQGYYIHDEITVQKNLVISAGYRRDRARFLFEPGTPDSVAVDEDAYTAGLNYAYSGKSYLYASYTRGFRYPVLDEFFSFFTNTVDTRLMPQQTDDYEGGFRHYLGVASYAQLNLFRMDLQKEIFFNPTTFANENLDVLTRRQGVELSFLARVAAWLSVQGSYTYLQAEIRGGKFSGKDIPGVAKNKATLGASFFPAKDFSFTVNALYVGNRPFISDFNNAFGEQDSYYVVNPRLEYRRGRIKTHLGINNLFNRNYAEYGVLGGFPLERGFYPSPERNFIVGISLDI